MKIILISIFPDIQSFGIRSISACLKKEGHDVDLVFLPKPFTEKYSDKTMDDLVKLTKGSDLVGITLMSNFWDSAIQITNKVKQNDNNVKVIWGGTHPTIRPEECLDHADMVCVGEGEETLIELTRKMQKEEFYYDTKGMGFNHSGKRILNKLRELPGSSKAMIKSLDDIPFQDHDYKSHYIMTGENIVKMNIDIVKKLRLSEFYQTQPTRGCPFACTFCVNNTFLAMHPHQKPLRKRSVDNVINELLEVKKNLPFTKIILFDDDAFFIMPLEEIRDFSIKYKKLIKLPLVITGATPSTLTQEKLSLLVEAGLVGMRMGIQSAGEKTKKLYKRPHSNKQVANAVKMVNGYKNKVKAYYDIILDSPWDTDENSIETLMFLSGLPAPFHITLFSLVFFPGTDLYRKAKDEGIIKDDINDIYRKHYHGCQPTYLNKLHFLLADYALVGLNINPKIMSFLTNKWVKKLFLHWPSYKILRAMFPFFRYVGRRFIPAAKMYKNGWDSITKKDEDYNPSSYLEVEDSITEVNEEISIDNNKNDSEEKRNEPLSA